MGRLTAYLLLFATVVFIGCVTAPIQDRSYQEVIQIDTMKKNKIYDKSLQWAALGFKSSKAVLQYQDKDEGKIIGQYVVLNGHCTIDCTMQIDIKDFKARLSFSSATQQQCARGGIYGGGTTAWAVESYAAGLVMDSFKELTRSYQSYILNTGASKSDDW